MAAAAAAAAVKWVVSKKTILKHLSPIQNGAVYCVCHKSMYSLLPGDCNCKEPALTSDGRTVGCCHPSVDIYSEQSSSGGSYCAAWVEVAWGERGKKGTWKSRC
uniref:Large ribosomal subunit protein mL42 n=1 Tax=Oryctolagus cuniculus TaxID=9986 RepID=A0A5F9CA39_RABIT